MTITNSYTLPNWETLTTVEVPVVSSASFALIGVETTNNGKQATYVVGSGDQGHQTEVVVNYNFVERALKGRGETRFSIRIKTWMKTENSVSGSVTYEPVSFLVAGNVAGRSIILPTETLNALGMAYSLSFLTVDENDEPELNVITKLAAGKTDVY